MVGIAEGVRELAAAAGNTRIAGHTAFAAVAGIVLQIDAASVTTGLAWVASVATAAAMIDAGVQIHAFARAVELTRGTGIATDATVALFTFPASLGTTAAVVWIHVEPNTLLTAFFHATRTGIQASALIARLSRVAWMVTCPAVQRIDFRVHTVVIAKSQSLIADDFILA